MGTYFSRLGKDVSSRWGAGGRTEAGLVDAAEAAMCSLGFPPGLDAATVLEEVAREGVLPPQDKNDPFGQPPILMYAQDDLYIQALFWMEGTTAIHDHGFAGSFGVLEGSSLHITYDFDVQEQIGDDRLLLGDLRPRHAEVLTPGAVRRIEPGSGFIHALFHLEMPTVSIVVRNQQSRESQFDYRFPGIAFDAWGSGQTWDKRLQSLFALDRVDSGRAFSLASEMVETLPLREAWVLLDRWVKAHSRSDSSLDLVDVLARRAPSMAGALGVAVEHALAQQRILRRRALLKGFHQRSFLALMANLATVEFTLDLIGQLAPGRAPNETLFDWTEELSGPSLRSLSGLMIDPSVLEELRALPGVQGAERLLEVVRSQWDDPMRKVSEVLAPF